MLVSCVLLALLLITQTEANLAGSDAKIRAREALANFREETLFQTNHGLVLVPVATEELKTRSKRSTEHKKYKRLSHSVHVQSDIRYRYATTLVTSEVFNPEQEAREIYMTVILPDTAFISRFAIELGGQLFVAYVREKENAWREYQEAVSQGKTAGHVGISARHSNQFRVSVNTEAKSSVTFYLLYEELLQRKRGIYEHVINLTPRQKLKDFGIDVQIKENRPITDLSVPGLKRHKITIGNATELENAHILKDPSHPGSARISYRPDLASLQKMLKSHHALQFSVKYDVDRQSDKAGEIQVIDGFFAHFVAPENLPPMAKHVVFVLDVSGSMDGKKLIQVKNAMKSILGQLRDIDFFSIVEFSDEVTEWRPEATAATKESVEVAREYVDAIQAKGGTNIHAGLIRGLQRIKESGSDSAVVVQPMIIFLTDGHATVGITDKEAILMDIQALNSELFVPLFGLSFGRFADFGLLKTLSLQNHAFTRKIYIAADAALQLEGFYKEVSSPILREVQFKYQADEILADSLTSTNFHTYYQGSEMVVAGKLADQSNLNMASSNLIEYEILATEADGPYKVNGEYNSAVAASQAEFYPQTITETVFDVLPRVREAVNGVNFLERLWAYLTIKDLLERVARGELNSCSPKKRHVDPIIDDEDYDTDKEGSGQSEEYYYDLQDEKSHVEDIISEVGDDENIVICDNIERALYLSLKYEFVTPLTSLVVVSPDNQAKEGDLSEIGGQHSRRHTINLMSTAVPNSRLPHSFLIIVTLIAVLDLFF